MLYCQTTGWSRTEEVTSDSVLGRHDRKCCAVRIMPTSSFASLSVCAASLASGEVGDALRRCTECTQLPLCATWFPLRACPLGGSALQTVQGKVYPRDSEKLWEVLLCVCAHWIVNQQGSLRESCTTPTSHTKNSLSKICSKGWVAQKPFVW